MMNNICVVSSTRADFGQLFWLIEKIKNDPQLNLQLIVTGSHLSPAFGNTNKEIIENGFEIIKKIEIILSSDSPVSISKSMGLAQISFSETFQEINPDIVIILGDRAEMLAVASVALIAGIPIAHIHGGEVTEGAYDDSIRHAITKLSNLHFTSTEQYRNRVIQMGENPEFVFNVGALAIESVLKIKYLSKSELEKKLGFTFKDRVFLITYHPETSLSADLVYVHFDDIIAAIDDFENTSLIFTYPNTDKNGDLIIRKIEEYVSKNSEKAKCFKSLGQVGYLSALKIADVVIGNSSSGILEAPALKTATVNIGDRQKGRIIGPTIFNCKPTKEEIIKSIKGALNYDRFSHYDHPYGDGNTSDKIIKILKEKMGSSQIKHFFDIDFK